LAEFSTVHHVGDTYLDRRKGKNMTRLPAWLLEARTIESLSAAYQLPAADFLAVNPGVKDPKQPLADGSEVRVPDRRWVPTLAAHLAARVLHAAAFTTREKVRLLLKLTLRAADEATALDTVLARLLLAVQPSDEPSIAHYEQVLTRYAPPKAADAAAFE